MFFIIAPKWKPLKNPKTVWMNKVWYPYTMEGYWVINRSELRTPICRHGNQGGHQIDTCRGWPALLHAPAPASVSGTQNVKRMSPSIIYSGPRSPQPRKTWRTSSPHAGKDHSSVPACPDCQTQSPSHRTPFPWRRPTASLENLPGSGLSFPTEELEWAVILEASSGARGVPPPRSVVLASVLAGEVRVGLAWGMVLLGRKREVGLAIFLMGQGESVLRDNHFYRE